MLKDYQPNEYLQEFAILREIEIKYDRNNQPYLSVLLQDKSSIIDGKMWHISEEIAQSFKQGQVVYVAGELKLFNKRPQLKIDQMRLAKNNEPNDPSLYMDSAPLSTEELMCEMSEYIDALSEPYHSVIQALMKEYGDRFYHAPAAKKNHHNYSGGLAYHTLSMLRLSKGIVACYPQLNASLLYAGIITHDFGKIWEMSGAVATEYTLAGELMGHLVLMDEVLNTICNRYDIDIDEDILMLKHMILSHHGKLEYGSPVKPKLLEAEVLHQIDYMDATINMITTALTHSEEGRFTERIAPMDGRSFYHPKEK